MGPVLFRASTKKAPAPLAATITARNLGLTAQKVLSQVTGDTRFASKHWSLLTSCLNTCWSLLCQTTFRKDILGARVPVALASGGSRSQPPGRGRIWQWGFPCKQCPPPMTQVTGLQWSAKPFLKHLCLAWPWMLPLTLLIQILYYFLNLRSYLLQEPCFS